MSDDRKPPRRHEWHEEWHDKMHNHMQDHLREHEAWRGRGPRRGGWRGRRDFLYGNLPTRWLLRHSMRRRVFRGLFAIALLTGSVVYFLLHGDSVRPEIFLRRHPIIFIVAGTMLIGSVSSLLARAVSRPLEEVAEFAEALGSGNLSARLRVRPRGQSDERVVQTALNRMADRLAQQLDDQRALLGAVSHELRSPLSRMKILAELIRSGDSAAIAKVEREIAEMDQLVGDLLANSRIDFGALRRVDIDAASLALQALESTESAPEKLNVERDEPIAFSADATLAARAIINLVLNAERHGGGLTELRVRRTADKVEFAALDAGPGFGADELERVFLPFQQTSTKAASVGLGLSLVRRIAHAHGGRAYAANRPAGGAIVAIEFPLPTTRVRAG